MDMDLEGVERILSRSGVLGPVQHVMFLGEGEFTSAWLVNEEWVCRCAKHADAATSLRREACLLPKVASGLSLHVPEPVCHVLPDEPLTFAIHPLIAGEALTRDRFEALDDAGQDWCAGQVARFLTCFHQVNPALAQSCGVKRVDYHSRYEEVQKCAEQYLALQLSSADWDYVQRVLKRFLSTEVDRQEDFGLLHGDVSPDHVLWNPIQKEVVGILDFGDMEIGDVAWDLVYIWGDYGPNFMRRFIRHFRSSHVESLLRRAYRFSELDAVEWAANVCAGTRDGDRKEFLGKITSLRSKENQAPWRKLL